MSATLVKKLNSIIDKTLTDRIMPIKTKHGILVGDVEIVCDGSLKHIKQNKKIVYKGIFLNITAITIANMLATRKQIKTIEPIYAADQTYGRFYIDSQMLRIRYNQSLEDDRPFNTDVLWAKYTERVYKVKFAKQKVEHLVKF